MKANPAVKLEIAKRSKIVLFQNFFASQSHHSNVSCESFIKWKLGKHVLINNLGRVVRKECLLI
jgi:hypothetical protein